jgi:predicted nucleotidyltransferase
MTTRNTTYMQALNGRAMPPSIQRLITVANDLDDVLRGQIVFIGGSVLPLLETDRTVLRVPRSTKDVDGVTGATSYTKLFMLEEALRARGFRNVTQPPTHIGRWRSPSQAIFDLVSAGNHAGGSGSERDQYALESAVTLDLPPTIRHVSGVGFLVMKFNAYRDRGTMNPRGSKDLSDLVALAATRPELLTEVSQAPEHVRRWICDGVDGLLSDPTMESHVIAHVSDRDPLVDNVAEQVLEVLAALARLS